MTFAAAVNLPFVSTVKVPTCVVWALIVIAPRARTLPLARGCRLQTAQRALRACEVTQDLTDAIPLTEALLSAPQAYSVPALARPIPAMAPPLTAQAVCRARRGRMHHGRKFGALPTKTPARTLN